MKKLIKLFLIFSKIGIMTFGGGYAMLPIIIRELVEKRGLASEEEILDYFAVAQCTPGVIAVNTATFIGKKQAGVAGGIVATLGVIFPSLGIIILIAALLGNYSSLPWLDHAFRGIRACVCVLIINAVISLARKNSWNIFYLIIFALVFISSIILSPSPAVLVLVSALAGVIYSVLRKENDK